MAGNYVTYVDADTPIAHWRLNETSGTAATDRVTSPAADNGVYTAGFTLNQASPFVGEAAAKSVDLNGTTGYIAIGATVATKLSTDLDSDNNVSFEAWVNLDVNNAEQMIACLRADATGWRFGITSGGKILWNVAMSTGFNSYAGNTTLSTGVWYHVVVTYDGTTVRFYLNGQPDGTSTTNVGNLAFTGGPMDLGRYGGFGGGFLNGRLQDVAIYSNTISAAHILDHYNEALGVSNVSQSAPVANISVAGLAPTVGIADFVQADVVDIAVAGLAPTVTAEQNVSISADVTDIAVAGHPAGVGTGGSTIISAEVADIAVAGQAATLTLDSTVEADTGAVTVTGQAPTVTASAVIQKQYLRPDSTVIAAYGNHLSIDEVVANDDDMVTFNAEKALLVVGLSDVVGMPNLRDDHLIRVRWMSVGPSALNIELRREGSGLPAEVIASWTGIPTAANWVTVERELTYEQTKALQLLGLTNGYNQLRLYIRVTGGSGGYVSWAEMEIPAAGGNYLYVDAPVANVAVAGVAPTFAGGVVDAIGVAAPAASTISVQGHPPSISTGTEVSISVDPTNVAVVGYATTIGTGGTIVIGVEAAEVRVAGSGPGLTTDRTVNFLAEVVDVVVSSGAADVRTGPDQLSFRFIEDTYAGLSTADAVPLQDLNFGPMLHGQSKTVRFRLGNSSPVATHFLIYARSNNPGLAPMVEFSLDNYTYADTLPIGSILPNGITDVIWMRITVAPDAFIGEGSFLVEVMQDVA